VLLDNTTSPEPRSVSTALPDARFAQGLQTALSAILTPFMFSLLRLASMLVLLEHSNHTIR